MKGTENKRAGDSPKKRESPGKKGSLGIYAIPFELLLNTRPTNSIVSDSTLQELSTPKSNSTYFVIHQNPSAKHGINPTSHLTTTTLQLVLGLIIVLAIMASVAYQMYKRAKR